MTVSDKNTFSTAHTNAYYDGFHKAIFSRNETTQLEEYLQHYSAEEREARIAIYRNNTFYSLKNALGDLYPAVACTIGEDLFSLVSREYFLLEPPSSPCMIDIGKSFPQFIANFPATKEFAYLPDLANFELRYHQSYHAEDCRLASADDFSSLDISELASATYSFAPSATLLGSPFAIYNIWNLAINASDSKETIQADNAQHILIARPEIKVEAYLIPEELFVFLRYLFDGLTLAESLSNTAETFEEFDPSAAIAFLIQSNITKSINTQT